MPRPCCVQLTWPCFPRQRWSTSTAWMLRSGRRSGELLAPPTQSGVALLVPVWVLGSAPFQFRWTGECSYKRFTKDRCQTDGTHAGTGHGKLSPSPYWLERTLGTRWDRCCPGRLCFSASVFNFSRRTPKTVRRRPTELATRRTCEGHRIYIERVMLFCCVALVGY